MKLFRFLMMTMAAIVLAGFVSCSDDATNSGGDDNADGTQTRAHISVAISVPNESATTRASDTEGDTNDKDAGTADEFAIKNATLYFFTQGSLTAGSTYAYEGTYVQSLTIAGSSLSAATGGATDPKTYTTTSSQSVSGLKPGESYHVYAVINGTTNLTLSKSTTEKMFLETSLAAGFSAGLVTESTLAGGTGWLMSSRGKAKDNATTPNTVQYSTLNIHITNNATNAATTGAVSLDVERVMGKLQIKEGITDNEYPISYTNNEGTPIKYADVTLEEVTVLNTRTDGYLFRRIARIPLANDDAFSSLATAPVSYEKLTTAAYTNNKITTAADYILDPRTKEKTDANIANSSYLGWYSAKSAATNMSTLNSTYSTLGYCLENTMHSSMQINGYTTGLMFKATVVPTGNILTAGSLEDETSNTPITWNSATYPTFFNHGNRFYSSFQALANDGIITAAKAAEYATKIAGSATDKADVLKELRDANVTRCENGICYYTYWIKHQPNDQHLAVMEFAIARNNVYRMAVTSISGIGGSSDTIVPEDENETTVVYLQVELNVLPWIVREQDDIRL